MALYVFGRVNNIKLKLLLLLTVILIVLSACEDRKTTEILPPENTEPLVLVGNGKCDYTVIRSDYSNGADVKAAILICNIIEDRTGLRPNITTDWDGNPVTEREIIIGETLREKTEGHYIDRAALGKSGYIIEAAGEKIYITGGSEEATYTAVEYFLDIFVKNDSTDVTMDRDYKYAVYQEFAIRSFYICDKNYNDFIIIFDSAPLRQAAETLSDALADKTGKKLEVIEDKDYLSNYVTSDNIILLTSKKPDINGIHLVKAENGRLIFASSGSETGVTECVSRFITQYIENASGDCRISEGFIYAVTSDYISIKDPRVS